MAISWPRPSSSHANGMVDSFKDNLRSVAETFAEHERVDSVSKKHVDEAYSALARLGLHSKTFWQRSDTWTAFGAFLVGLSVNAPDVSSSVCGFLGASDTVANALAVSSLIVLAGLGIGLFFFARNRGTLPQKPGAV